MCCFIAIQDKINISQLYFQSFTFRMPQLDGVWEAHLTDLLSNRKVSQWPSAALASSSHSPALLPHSREVNLKGSSSLLCVGACISERRAWFTVDGTVRLTLQEMLMQGAWDCFKVVKRDQSPEDEVNLGYCALLPDECGRHRDEDNRSPAIFSLLWWMCYKNPTQPWMLFFQSSIRVQFMRYTIILAVSVLSKRTRKSCLCLQEMTHHFPFDCHLLWAAVSREDND